MAATVTAQDGTILLPTQSSTEALGVTQTVALKRDQTYMIRVAAETTRPAMQASQSALGAAVDLATISNLAPIIQEHASWWSDWWNASSIDLGPSRQVLEGFYYGAQASV